MAQKLHDMASNRPEDFEAAQREFNAQQMMPRPQPTMQQQQQVQPKKKD
jgi:hemin uptake protein HemP